MASIAFENTQDIELTGDLLAYWLPGYSFRFSELSRIYRIIGKAGATLGIWDEESTTPVSFSTRRYQYEVLKEAFDAAARNYLPYTYKEQPPHFLKGKKKKEGLYKVKLADQSNLNRIAKEAAIALPGLGSKSARALLSVRQLDGAFLDWESVKTAAGIDQKALERLKKVAYLGPVEANEIEAGVHQAVRDDGVGALVDFLLEGELTWEELETVEDPFDVIYGVASRLADHIMADPHRPRFWKPSKLRMAHGTRHMEQYDEMVDAMPSSIKGVTYVRGSQYLHLVQHLVEQATESIRLSMFFFHLPESGPGRELYDQLKAARDRGVAIKLIIDNDLEGDYHNARNVNASLFEALDADGIPYHTSYPDRTNHTKLLIVDEQYVLSGSHNWTASSFYRYEETSFLVDSAALGMKSVIGYDKLYQMLAEDDRTIYLSELNFLSEDEKTKLADLGLTTQTTYLPRIDAEDWRTNFSGPYGIDKDKLKQIFHVLTLMEDIKISETTAVTLVLNEVEKKSEVRNKTEEELAEIVSDLSHLPEPFKYRSIPSGVPQFLKSI